MKLDNEEFCKDLCFNVRIRQKDYRLKVNDFIYKGEDFIYKKKKINEKTLEVGQAQKYFKLTSLLNAFKDKDNLYSDENVTDLPFKCFYWGINISNENITLFFEVDDEGTPVTIIHECQFPSYMRQPAITSDTNKFFLLDGSVSYVSGHLLYNDEKVFALENVWGHKDIYKIKSISYFS